MTQPPRPRRAPSAAAVALAAALTLGGCGTLVEAVPTVPSATLPPEAVGLPADAVPGPSADRASGTGAGAHEPLEDADVVDLVARMDAVLTEGTEDDWAAFFEGEELVEQQRRWFRAVREVPMDVRELLPDAVVERDTGDGTVVQLVLAHQVTGADPVPARESYRMTVRRAAGQEPLVSAVEGADRSDGHPQLWDLDAVDVTVTDQLVLLAPAGRRDDVTALLPGLESAVANVFLDFGTGGRQRLVVQLVDEATLRAIADDTGLAVDPAGVSITMQGLGERPAPGELGVGVSEERVDRVVLDLDLLVEELAFGTPPGGWGLMRHEAVHAVMDGDPDVRPPVWVWEGLAEWYGYRRDYVVDEAYRAALDPLGEEPLELPDSFSDYYYDSQEAGELAYASSAMVFSFLEQRFGFETARDVGVGLTRVDTWRDAADADALLVERTGLTLEALEREWAAWAAATYG
ncbi:hypothetical protein [Ornithinimicrobium pekingense]|uniref:hypothetical protein n=1 Tax=Ornithinimicrobium pekingense TaxID=384677 RepID=UPI0003B7728E|nr:hypothetical protein [Ornithinimicrobium pekingense]